LILQEIALRTLPVGPTIRHMLSSTLNNLAFALRAQWPWMLIVAGLLAVLGFYNPIPANLTPEENQAFFREHAGQLGSYFLLGFAVVLVAMLGFSSVAVAWHRYILLDEVPEGMAKLRVDKTVWRYFGNLLLISIMIFLAALPLSFLIIPIMAMNSALGFMGILLYSSVVLTPIFYRLSIKLPAIALGRQDFRIGDAWAASNGNWWQIVLVALGVSALSLGAALIMFLTSRLFNTVLGTSVGFWADLLVQLGVNWVITVMGITLLTSLYGYFVEKREF
jgi:hypothetical protein